MKCECGGKLRRQYTIPRKAFRLTRCICEVCRKPRTSIEFLLEGESIGETKKASEISGIPDAVKILSDFVKNGL